MRVLESKRLLIKPIEEEDLQYLLELRWEQSIMNYLIHEPLSLANQKKWFSSLSSKDIPFLIWLKSDNNKYHRAGTVGLYNINTRHQRAIWRVRLDPLYQGKGIAYEAVNLVLDYGFNTLNINKIISDSFADNQAIVNLSQKLGFKKEGLLKKHYFHKGEFRDAIQFGLLREDFNKKNIANKQDYEQSEKASD
jgi:diamine N-acetyltransferase